MEKSIEKFPVIVRYSFDSDTPVYLFDSKKEALEFLKKDFENEIKIDNESGDLTDKNYRTYISESGTYASITKGAYNNPTYEDAVTEWFLGHIDTPRI